MTPQTNPPADQEQKRSGQGPDPRELFPERNEYFTGKYMTARDFRDEQRYFLSHHRWHAWNLHGWGIVWGLAVKVETHTRGAQCVTVYPGMALDCYGRELVLPHPVHFSVAEVAGDRSDKKPQDFLLGLKLRVRSREPVPVLLNEENCGSAERAHNRTQEYAVICHKPYCKECWTPPPSYLPAPLPSCSNDAVSFAQHEHADECACPPPAVTIDPPCGCGEEAFVPLAHFRWKTGRNEGGNSGEDKDDGKDNGHWVADDLGCRYVRSPFYGEALTHIVGINWRHGRRTNLSSLTHDYDQPDDVEFKAAQRLQSKCDSHVARLVLTFDRALMRDPLPPVGEKKSPSPDAISAYFSQLLHLEYVPLTIDDLDGDDPPGAISWKVVKLSPDRKQLLCDFPVGKLQCYKRVLIRLTLNCDMLIDERGRAVDGEHLNGQVPYLPGKCEASSGPSARSGNGLEGGLFHSWTKLVVDTQEAEERSSPINGSEVD